MIMAHKKLVLTDKWPIAPVQRSDKALLLLTVEEYRKLCRYLGTVVMTHWPSLASLSANQVTPAVERLIHRTKQNPNPKYELFARVFYKFPSYYRRAAISFAFGQVSSFQTRYREWVNSNSRKRRDAKPPRFNPDAGCYPSLYEGQCIRYRCDIEDKKNIASIKLFTGSDWVWVDTVIKNLGKRLFVNTNRMLSPALIANNRSCHLSTPFHCKPEKVSGAGNVTAVDLGINTTATVRVVDFNGTVIHTEFIHPGRDIDRRDKRLKSISVRASKTMGSGGKLHKGFCSNTYRKCRDINGNIAHHVSKRIAAIAQEFNSNALVFENLKGWKPRGGKKRSNLKQRFHGWLKSRIFDYTQAKWAELGGKTITVLAAYTSKLAYDGSGVVKRDPKNYALALFPNGRRYNADCNGANNIAGRGIIKLLSGNKKQSATGKSSGAEPRRWACLCELWDCDKSFA